MQQIGVMKMQYNFAKKKQQKFPFKKVYNKDKTKLSDKGAPRLFVKKQQDQDTTKLSNKDVNFASETFDQIWSNIFQ